ncbi:MAG: response regulator transcription factor [Magnetospirillum sp. WYHS-4]
MKILVADDHVLFRSGMRHVLQELDTAVEVIEAGNFEAIRREIAAHPDMDLALVDLDMPGMNGWSGVKALSQSFPDLPLVMVSGSETPEHVRRALANGAMGYIPKTSGVDVMVAALRLVLSGGVYLPPTLLEDEAGPVSRTGTLALRGGGPHLTRRQLDVLRLMADGRSNKEIARLLDIAEGTVKIHVSAVMDALGCANRTEAVTRATRLGLISLDQPSTG